MNEHVGLGDEQLMERLQTLVSQDRRVLAELLRCLAEVDQRKLYLPRGYPSLFRYCQDVLNMAEPAIYTRITAARLCRRFPRLLEALEQGRLHLSAIVLLAPVVTECNLEALTQAASHKSKRDVERPDGVHRPWAAPQSAALARGRPRRRPKGAQEPPRTPLWAAGADLSIGRRPVGKSVQKRDARWWRNS